MHCFSMANRVDLRHPKPGKSHLSPSNLARAGVYPRNLQLPKEYIEEHLLQWF